MASKAQILVLAGAYVVAAITTGATAVLFFDEAAKTSVASELGVGGRGAVGGGDDVPGTRPAVAVTPASAVPPI